MMKRGWGVALGAVVAMSAGTASAAEYGKAGVVEVGGTFSLGSGTTDYDKGGKTTDTAAKLEPSISYFVIDNLAVAGLLSVDYDTSKDDQSPSTTDTTTAFGVGAGVGYFVPVSNIHVGPVLSVKLINGTDESKSGGVSTKDTTSGTDLAVGVLAKVPVGGAGVATAGLVFDQQNLKLKPDVGASVDETITTIGATVGFSVYFGGK